MRKTTGEIPFLLALRMEMAALNLTQRDLARKTGISDWQMSKVLHRKTVLTPTVRAKLILALHAETLASAHYTVTAPIATHESLTA